MRFLDAPHLCMYHALMNVLMVLADRDFPPDIRVEKQVRSLKGASHGVSILCGLKGARPPMDTWEGCAVIRVPKAPGISRKLFTLRRIVDFYNTYWAKHIESTIQYLDIQILHVHDLPMLGTVLRIARKRRLPVLADLHENYAAALAFYQGAGSIKKYLLKKIYYRQSRWEAYEIRSAQKSDQILVVVDEAKTRLMEQGIPCEKVNVIENTVDVDQFLSYPLDEDIVNQYHDRYVLLYLGGFGGAHRGLETAIRAMPQITGEIPNALLLLVGDGSIKPKLEKMVKDLSLVNYVEFIPWQPFELTPTFITLSSVCLVPHLANAHTNATSPHKLFQYMLMGKPVVVSTCKPIKRIVQETNSGLVFDAGSPSSLAKAVNKLRHSSLRDRFGANGRNAVLEKYNWGRTSRKLLAIYDQFS